MVTVAVLAMGLAIIAASDASPASMTAGPAEEGSSILMVQLDSQPRSLSAEFTRSGGIAGLVISGRVAVADDKGTLRSADNAYSRPLSAEELTLFSPRQLEAAARQIRAAPDDPTRDGYVYQFKATLADGSAVTLDFPQQAVRDGPAILGWIERACEEMWRSRLGAAP
jgi:hypothetical protein